jgi:hypothetical protein
MGDSNNRLTMMPLAPIHTTTLQAYKHGVGKF